MTRPRLAAPLAVLALLLPAASRAADAPVTAEVWGRSAIPIGDPAFTADGRLVTSHHPAFATAERVSVFATPDRLEPYPNADWNAGLSGPDHLDSVQGLHTDSKGVMWMGDMGEREENGAQDRRLGHAGEQAGADHPSAASGDGAGLRAAGPRRR